MAYETKLKYPLPIDLARQFGVNMDLRGRIAQELLHTVGTAEAVRAFQGEHIEGAQSAPKPALTPAAVAVRVCDIAEQFVNQLEERGWVAAAPNDIELVEHIEILKDKLAETRDDRSPAFMKKQAD